MASNTLILFLYKSAVNFNKVCYTICLMNYICIWVSLIWSLPCYDTPWITWNAHQLLTFDLFVLFLSYLVLFSVLSQFVLVLLFFLALFSLAQVFLFQSFPFRFCLFQVVVHFLVFPWKKENGYFLKYLLVIIHCNLTIFNNCYVNKDHNMSKWCFLPFLETIIFIFESEYRNVYKIIL